MKTQAQAALKTSWSRNPPFSEVDFYPGASSTAVLEIENLSGKTELLQFFVNIQKDGGLLPGLRFGAGGQTIEFDKTSTIGTIAKGATIYVPVMISFGRAGGNDYRGKSVEFNMCVGFETGERSCSFTTIEAPVSANQKTQPVGSGSQTTKSDEKTTLNFENEHTSVDRRLDTKEAEGSSLGGDKATSVQAPESKFKFEGLSLSAVSDEKQHTEKPQEANLDEIKEVSNSTPSVLVIIFIVMILSLARFVVA